MEELCSGRKATLRQHLKSFRKESEIRLRCNGHNNGIFLPTVSGLHDIDPSSSGLRWVRWQRGSRPALHKNDRK